MQPGQIKTIVLMTDFGQKDTYAGIMKGVIRSISPEAYMIDLTHDICARDILQGAFLLTTSFLYFPKGSIFCVVVDPGVGSVRKPICIETRDYFFIGPDNGVLYSAAKAAGIRQIVELSNPDYFLCPVSGTFHGRDVFAPVAAHLSKGIPDIRVLGKPVKKIMEFEYPRASITREGGLELSIIHIDRFGNLILNLDQMEFDRFIRGRRFCLSICGEKITRVVSHYAAAEEGELFLLVSSFSHMEIALKNTSAADALKATCLTRALLERFDPQK